MKTKPQLLSTSTLSGDKVKNAAGDDLGKIEDFMVDLDSGRIAYAVLSFGGVLGMGNKLFAIPWQALTLNANDHSFLLNIPKETLENAPGFDKDHWPDMSDTGWGTRVYSHYGYEPYWRN
jgi:sporulation protein YlmC with PRC-barrel domain